MAGKDAVYRGSLNMNVTEMFGVTVASMGLFQDDGDLEKYQYSNHRNGTYLKILMRNQRPVGGVLLGSSEDVKILGTLRPLIRRKTEVPYSEDFLRDVMEKRVFFRNLMA